MADGNLGIMQGALKRGGLGSTLETFIASRSSSLHVLVCRATQRAIAFRAGRSQMWRRRDY